MRIPLAGIAAAFVFAAQMVNFPVAAGTTGHLIGAALAAILLGPHMGALVVAVVVVVQAFVFADGGITALGYNVLNMAIVPAYGGYAAFTLFRRLLPASSGGVVASTALAGWVSVLLAAMAFSIEWLFGATAPVSFTDVFVAMVGVHMLIGIGEGLISATAAGAVLASRPDLVFGAGDLDREGLADRRPVKARAFLIACLIAVLFVAGIVSQFAADAPDGLERVAEETGIDPAETQSPDWSIFADYATSGIENEGVGLAVAGIAGAVIVSAVGSGLLIAVRRRPGDDHPKAA
jgi:cobalt/nickel transport system permease protein